MREYVIELPLPVRALNPHAKGNWRPKAKATKDAKTIAFYFARQVLNGTKPLIDKCEVSMSYDTSAKKGCIGYRANDVQNAISACKAYIDGCTDAGLIVDDSAKHLSWGKCQIVKEGRPGVTLTFREVD